MQSPKITLRFEASKNSVFSPRMLENNCVRIVLVKIRVVVVIQSAAVRLTDRHGSPANVALASVVCNSIHLKTILTLCTASRISSTRIQWFLMRSVIIYRLKPGRQRHATILPRNNGDRLASLLAKSSQLAERLTSVRVCLCNRKTSMYIGSTDDIWVPVLLFAGKKIK